MSRRKWAKFDEAKDAILAAHEVSLVEWSVLDMVRLKVPLPPNELARYLVTYREGLGKPEYTTAEYSQAIDLLVEKGLLCVLGFADAVSPAPPYSTWDDEMIDKLEGHLDFTPEGFALMKQVSDAYEAQYRRPFLPKKSPQS